MDKSNYNIQIQSEGTQNYIVVDMPMGTEVIEYCRKVLEKNKIPGLLTPNYQFLNGEIRFKYSINGKRAIRELVQSGGTNEKNEILILKNLTRSLKTLSTYLIDLDKVWLDPQYLFIGDGMQVFMVCVPVEDNSCVDISKELKNFFLELLSDYLGSGNNRYSDMFMWVYKQSIFDLELFEKEFLKEESKSVEKPQVKPISENVESRAYQPPKQQYTAPPKPLQPPVNKVENVENKREKSGPFGFGFGKGKKETNSNPSIAVPGGVIKTPTGNLNIPGVKSNAVQSESADVKENKRSGINFFGKKKSNDLEKSGQPKIIPYIVHRGNKIDINKTPFTMGQGSSAYPVDYVIQNNPRVSHRHAVIVEKDGEFYVSDNGSTNGTILNGMDVKPGTLMPLKDGDEIRLYNEIICFYLT